MRLNCFGKMNRKRNNNSGATMIVAIVIMGLLIVFTFSLMLVAYTYYSSQTKNTASLRCSEAANSLSLSLKEELTSSNPENSELYRYLRYNLCQTDTWPYHKDGLDGHGKESYRKFDLKYNSARTDVDGIEGLPGNTLISIYWELPDGVTDTQVFASDYTDKRNGIKLYIDVTCESGSQSYTVTSVYSLELSKYPANDNHLKTIINAFSSSSANPLSKSAKGIVALNGIDNEKWTWNYEGMY